MIKTWSPDLARNEVVAQQKHNENPANLSDLIALDELFALANF